MTAAVNSASKQSFCVCFTEVNAEVKDCLSQPSWQHNSLASSMNIIENVNAELSESDIMKEKSCIKMNSGS